MLGMVYGTSRTSAVFNGWLHKAAQSSMKNFQELKIKKESQRWKPLQHHSKHYQETQLWDWSWGGYVLMYGSALRFASVKRSSRRKSPERRDSSSGTNSHKTRRGKEGKSAPKQNTNSKRIIHQTKFKNVITTSPKHVDWIKRCSPQHGPNNSYIINHATK